MKSSNLKFFKFSFIAFLLVGLFAVEAFASEWNSLRERLTSEDIKIKRENYKELIKRKPFPEKFIIWLVEGLKTNKEEGLNWTNLVILGKLGPRAKQAVPVLIKIISDKTETPIDKIKVLWVLGEIGVSSSLVLPELVRITNDAKEETLLKVKAILALKKIGVEAQAAKHALKKLVSNKKTPPVLKAVSWETLATINPKDKQWIPRLVEMAEGKYGKSISLRIGHTNTVYHPIINGFQTLITLNEKQKAHAIAKKLLKSGDVEKEAVVLSHSRKLGPAIENELLPLYYGLVERVPNSRAETDLKSLFLSKVMQIEIKKEKSKRGKIVSLLNKLAVEDPNPKIRKQASHYLKFIEQL